MASARSGVSSCHCFSAALDPSAVTTTEKAKSSANPAAYLVTFQPRTNEAPEKAARNRANSEMGARGFATKVPMSLPTSDQVGIESAVAEMARLPPRK